MLLFPESMRSSKALTIPELLIASTIILMTSLAILFTYIQCMEISEIDKTKTKVLFMAHNMMETIQSTSFDLIQSTYNNQTFSLDGINGIGLTEIDDRDPKLLGIHVKCFWKQAKGRLVGEDSNLNGILDKGEDINKNGALDSPVDLFTYIYKR